MGHKGKKVDVFVRYLNDFFFQFLVGDVIIQVVAKSLSVLFFPHQMLSIAFVVDN
jgi:hypothetical protein